METGIRGFPGDSVVKNPPANAGDIRDTGSIPGSGRSLGGGHDNQLQYFHLEKLMDRGAWQATVLRITKNWTRLKQQPSSYFIDGVMSFELLPLDN